MLLIPNHNACMVVQKHNRQQPGQYVSTRDLQHSHSSHLILCTSCTFRDILFSRLRYFSMMLFKISSGFLLPHFPCQQTRFSGGLPWSNLFITTEGKDCIQDSFKTASQIICLHRLSQLSLRLSPEVSPYKLV